MDSSKPPRQTEILAISSGKGGTGKTLMSMCMAYALQRAGFKVLLVDTDVGTDGLTRYLTGGMGTKAVQQEIKFVNKPTFADLIEKGMPPGGFEQLEHRFNILQLTDSRQYSDEALSFPAVISTRNFDGDDDDRVFLASREQHHERLAAWFEWLRNLGKFDCVIADTRGGFTFQSADVCALADSYVIVCDPGLGSIGQSVNLYSRIVDRIRANRSERRYPRIPQLRGVVVNRAVGGVDRQERPFREKLVTEMGLGDDIEHGLSYTFAVPLDSGVARCYQNLEVPLFSHPHLPFCAATLKAFEGIFNISASAKWEHDHVQKWQALGREVETARLEAQREEQREARKLMARKIVLPALTVLALLILLGMLMYERGSGSRKPEINQLTERLSGSVRDAVVNSNGWQQTVMELTSVSNRWEETTRSLENTNQLVKQQAEALAKANSELLTATTNLSSAKTSFALATNLLAQSYSNQIWQLSNDVGRLSNDVGRLSSEVSVLTNFLATVRIFVGLKQNVPTSEAFSPDLNRILPPAPTAFASRQARVVADTNAPTKDRDRALNLMMLIRETEGLFWGTNLMVFGLPGQPLANQQEALKRLYPDTVSADVNFGLEQIIQRLGGSNALYELRGTAASLLDQYAPNPAARDALILGLDDPDARIQGYSVSSLRKFPRDPAAFAGVAGFLTNSAKSWDNRGAAASSLGAMQLEDAVPVLTNLIEVALRSPDVGSLRRVIGGAITSLGELKVESAVPVLVGYLSDQRLAEDLPGVVVSALQEYPSIGTNTAAAAQVLSLLDHTNDKIRGPAVTAAGLYGTTNMLSKLITVAGSTKEKPDIRGAAVTAIHRVVRGNRSTLPPALVEQATKVLLSLLGPESGEAQGTAITALGILRTDSAVQPLLAVLTNAQASARVRRAAATSLLIIGPTNRTVIEGMEGVMKDPRTPEDVVGGVASAVGFLGGFECVSPLLEVMKARTSSSVRKASDSSLLTIFVRARDVAGLPPIQGSPLVAVEAMNQHLPEAASRGLTMGVLGVGNVGNSKTITELLKLIENEKATEQSRSMAALAVGRICQLGKTRLTEEQTKSLLEMLERTVVDSSLSESLAAALVEGVSPTRLQEITKSLKSPVAQARIESGRIAQQVGKSVVEDFYGRAATARQEVLRELREESGANGSGDRAE